MKTFSLSAFAPPREKIDSQPESRMIGTYFRVLLVTFRGKKPANLTL